MVRSAASVVSALWGFVANGRQTSITFPLPSLKFRTAGFPQYGFKPVAPAVTFAATRTGGRLYTVVARSILSAVCLPLCEGWHRPARAFRPRGPWLGIGLFCPVTSSLTMASSEPLVHSRRFSFSVSVGSLLTGRGPEGP
jgi:hypothetical protein